MQGSLNYYSNINYYSDSTHLHIHTHFSRVGQIRVSVSHGQKLH